MARKHRLPIALLAFALAMLPTACSGQSSSHLSRYGGPYAARHYDENAQPTNEQIRLAHILVDEEHYERFSVNDMASGWPNSYLFELVTVAQMLTEKMGERYGVPFEPASGAERGYHMPEMMDKAWRVNVTPAAGSLRGRTFTATYTWDMTGVWEGTTPFITDDYFEALRGGDLRDYTSAAVDAWLQDHPDLDCVYRVAIIEAVHTEEQWTIPPDAPVEDLGKAFLSSVDMYVSPETPLDETRFEAFGREIKTALKARGLSPTVYSYQLTGSVADYKDGRFTLDSAEQAYRDGLYWDETTDAVGDSGRRSDA